MNNPKLSNQPEETPSIRSSGPTFALLQQDFPYQENVDSGHPLNLDYFIPINCQRVITARLSFKLRLYRSYSTISLTSTGGTTPTADATGESGHSHSHAHTIPIASSGAAAANINWNGPGTSLTTINNATGGNTTAINSDATGSSGHSHSHTHGSHTHTVSGTSTLGVSEDVNNGPSVNVLFDGSDHTADIVPAGPYVSDQVELDVTKFISTVVDRAWHTVSLSLVVRGRIQAALRILYSSNQV